MKRFLLFILVLFLSPFVVGQGAPDPETAFDNPSLYYFELNQNFTNGGNNWDIPNGVSYNIDLNENIGYNPIYPILHNQTTWDNFRQGCNSTSFEEWYIVVVPSNFIVNIYFSCSGASANDAGTKSIQILSFNDDVDLDNIHGCSSITTGPGAISIASDYTDNTTGSLSFNLTNSDINNARYLALRIGNNKGGPVNIYTQYSLSITTDNSICANALHVPITDGTKDPFFGDTDKAGVLINDPPSPDGIASTFYGAGDIAVSTGFGNWFKASSLVAENIYGALCGSSINPQLMIYTQCPTGIVGSNEYIGGENQNIDAGLPTLPAFDVLWNRDVCVTGGNNPNWPVIKFPAAIDDYFFYIYSSDGINDEFDFYLLNNQGGGILPVTWLSFDGYAIGKQNRIQWRTASEQQNDYFILEKSKDGENYMELARIEGAGNSTFEKSYSFIDSSPYAITFYRISQVDWDGTVHSGPQTVVENNATINNFHVLTNPVETNSIQLSYYITKEENIQIDLYTVNGVKVYSENRLLMKENNNFTVPINDMENGVYIISIKTNSSNYTQKIIIHTLH